MLMMTSLDTQENANCASQKEKRRKGNPMTTPKQRLIEAVNQKIVITNTMYLRGQATLEKYIHEESAYNKCLKLIEEILPNE